MLKLFYLPEAHTDFLYSILAEELGLVGAMSVLILFLIFIWRALAIGRAAELAGQVFAAQVAYGIGIWLGLQACINMGVNMGALPTKGLTLPLMSYGGSSLVIACIAIGLLFRVDLETRQPDKAAARLRR
jgi:cell division protein FtsW